MSEIPNLGLDLLRVSGEENKDLWVQGPGFGGLGFRVWGLGFGV